ncbi:MAG: hypothetical protein KDK34_12200, partial [Leptospiraceae bacterium]|nr:hypothetical protein [Leptospiraceae bacterium]
MMFPNPDSIDTNQNAEARRTLPLTATERSAGSAIVRVTQPKSGWIMQMANAQVRIPTVTDVSETLRKSSIVDKLRGSDEPHEFNRARRRTEERDWKRRVRSGKHLLQRHSRFFRAVALATLIALVYNIHLPGLRLAAQTFQEFDDSSRADLERFVDRAARQNDADAWTNYVETGVASEFIEWENDALDALSDRFNEIAVDESLSEEDKESERDAAR